MRRRARLHRAAWQPHLDATRRFVLSVAGKCKNRDKVVILGSGLLLDVPLAELSALFSEVALKDVACLPEVRKQINGFRNVTFVEQEVTGVAERLYRNRQQGIHRLPEVVPPADDDAGLAVSLNILSQLWVVPRVFVTRNFRGLAEDRIDDWCRQIVESHYAWLRARPGAVCLVADHAFITRDPEDPSSAGTRRSTDGSCRSRTRPGRGISSRRGGILGPHRKSCSSAHGIGAGRQAEQPLPGSKANSAAPRNSCRCFRLAGTKIFWR